MFFFILIHHAAFCRPQANSRETSILKVYGHLFSEQPRVRIFPRIGTLVSCWLTLVCWRSLPSTGTLPLL